jgi:MFS family permease
VVYGVVVILAAVNPWLWGMPVLFVVAGAAMTASNIAANSLLQTGARPEHLGRTVSLFMLAMRGGISIGSVVTGASVSIAGVQRALLVNGILAVVLQLAIGRAWARPPEERRSM